MYSPSEQFFRDVATHLLTQKRKAVIGDRSDVCAYRSPGGLKCAAGCMIPDELYDIGMERMLIDSVVENWPKLNLYFPDMSLARRLQTIHDSLPVTKWLVSLRGLGQSREFDVTFLEGIE